MQERRLFSSNRFFPRAAMALAFAAAAAQPAWATAPTIPYGNPGTYNPVDVSFTAAAELAGPTPYSLVAAVQ